MKKRTVSLLLALAMTVLLCGCGAKSASKNELPKQEQSESGEQISEPASQNATGLSKETEAVLKEIQDGKLYYSPFLYEDEDAPIEPDDSVHYTAECAGLFENEISGGEMDVYEAEDKIMHFIKIKNNATQMEYLALFSDIETLRQVFPESGSRVGMVGKEFVEGFAWESEGIVVDLQTIVTNDELMAFGFELDNLQ